LIGYSTILMGKNLQANAEIITIENHQKEAQTAAKNVERAQILPEVNIVVGDALKVIPHLDGCFDFAFIDANKQEYLGYLRLAERMFHEGTVVIADNAGLLVEQMSDYLSYVRKSGRYESRFVSVDEDGLEISRKL
jgi:predicted O-methyltransferase YrrM